MRHGHTSREERVPPPPPNRENDCEHGTRAKGNSYISAL